MRHVTPRGVGSEVARRGHKPEGTIVRANRVIATVTKIDYKKRTATAEGPDGKKVFVHAGPEVRRFNEVKKGDRIAIEITEALAVSVSHRGRADRSSGGPRSHRRVEPALAG